MIKSFLARRLKAQERELGESVEYLQDVLRASLGGFLKFAMFMPLAQHRRKLPIDAYSVARVVALQHEDCGTCLQVALNLARKAGVSTDVLQAALDGEPERLDPKLADVLEFTREVVCASGLEGPYRDRLRQAYGDEGLVELALAIASVRVFPTAKRALGHARSCSVARPNVNGSTSVSRQASAH